MQSRKKWKRRYYKERNRRKEADKATWQIYEDYQDAGKKMFEYAEQVEQLEINNKKIIEKLEEVINDDDMSDVEYQMKRELAIEILKITKGEKE